MHFSRSRDIFGLVKYGLQNFEYSSLRLGHKNWRYLAVESELRIKLEIMAARDPEIFVVQYLKNADWHLVM